MTTRRFLATAAFGLVVIACALALAELLDAPWLRVVAVALLLGIFIAREAWAWRGHGRTWLAISGALLSVFALAFLVQLLVG